MPEITTRLGPLRLTWDIEWTEADGRIIEVFANLLGISDDAFWQRTKREPQWTQKQYDGKWRRVWDWLDDFIGEDVAASDAAREAIDRERDDLRHEDAERLAER